ncbi:MAG: hypothetical protein FJX77_04300 [Armatimonadetes bacterium]|nr:hypothetical protein [Armatimonadota bacterium]
MECPLAHPTLMVRAEVLHQLGGYRAMGWAEDYDLCLRLWRAGVGLAKVPEVLFRWRDGRSRASRTLPEYAPEAFRQCKATFLQESYLADGRAPLLFGAGPVGKAMARALLSRGMRLAGFVDLDPRKVGQCIYGVQVLDQEHALALQGTVFGLAAVGQVGGRQALRATLGAAGWADGVDYCAVA